jgi:putative acetyltransferase
MAAVVIASEDPRQPDVLALLRQSDAFSAALYPPDSQHRVDADFLARPNVHFLVARRDGCGIGCGAVVLGGDGSAELKRMIVDASARGQRIGQALLAALEARAVAAGVRAIRLETGTLNHAALRLYQAAGYEPCGAFADYPQDDPLSMFMQKALPG